MGSVGLLMLQATGALPCGGGGGEAMVRVCGRVGDGGRVVLGSRL